MRIWLVIAAVLLLAVSLHAQNPYWEQLPGPAGGPVTCFATLPNGTVLASQSNGSLFRSSSDGMRWERIWSPRPLSDPWYRMWYPFYGDGVRYMVVTDEGTIIALFNSEPGARLMSSTDSGSSWLPLYPRFPRETVSLPAELVKGGDGALFLKENRSGTTSTEAVHVSEDGGHSWRILEGIDGATISLTGRRWFTSRHDGLYRSSDGGSSWSKLTTPFTQEISFTLLDDSILFCYPGDGSGTTWLTLDGGQSWTVCQGINRKLEAVHRLPSGLLAHSYSGLFFSADGGLNWETYEGVPGRYVLASILTTTGTLLAATSANGTVARSTDYGQHWDAGAEGMLRPAILDITFVGSRVYVSSLSGGVYYWTVGSTLPWESGLDPETYIGRLCVSPDGHVYAMGNDIWLHHPPGGSNQSWEWKDEPASLSSVQRAGQLVRGATNGGVILESHDEFTTWSSSTYIPPPPGVSQFHDIDLLTVPNSSGSTTLAATDHGMHRFDSGNSVWVNASLGGEYPMIMATAVAPDSAVYACTPYKVWRSTDAGMSWEPIFHSPDTLLAPAIAVSDNGEVFIANLNKIMRSTDKGLTWIEMPSLPHTESTHIVRSMGVDPDGRLYVGTFADGIFRTARSTMNTGSMPVIPEQLQILGIYPQPIASNSNAYIRFVTNRIGTVQLRIFDIRGRQRWQQKREVTDAASGDQYFELPLIGIGQGAYMLQLSGGEQSASRMIIVF